MQKIRIGIIGAGSRGIEVGECWVSLGVAEIVAVSDINPEALNHSKEHFIKIAPHCEYYHHNQAMLNRDDLDAVLVTTYDPYHAEPAIEVLEAGKNLFLEKPMAQTVEDCQRIVKAWRKSGKILVMGHECRYGEFIQLAREKIERGAIGKPIVAVTVDSCGRMGNYFRRPNTRTRDKVHSLTLQKGVHQLDLQGYLLGARPIQAFSLSGRDKFGGNKPNDLVCSRCDQTKSCPYEVHLSRANGIKYGDDKQELCVFAQEIDVHDNIVAVIDYDSGARSTYTECFFTPEYKVEHRIIGDEGQIDITYKYGFPSVVRISRINFIQYEEIILPPKEGHGGGDFALASAFCRTIIENKQIHPDGLDGYYAVALACALDESADKGRPVEISYNPII